MALRIHNTLTGKKEEFVPLVEGKVGMYVCGVTVYDLCHVGHARAGVVFDTLYRYLRHRGYDVTYVRNFTDIDDKIIRRAGETGMGWKAVAEKYIAEFKTDMGGLGLAPATVEPRATDHIGGMIALISTLMANGVAYESGGDVFFSVERFKGYGKLSKRNLDEMQAGARVDVDEKKGNPLDFALWKGSKPGEPSWESPWGPGRPGWHIECSVMSQEYLGDTIDIHGGGRDLIFPHHENEIAQSEAATGKPFVRYWIHNGFVNIDQEKMSKSLGNILTIKQILREWHPEVLRLFLLSSHYRSPLDFSFEALAEARTALDRFYAALQAVREEVARPAAPTGRGQDPVVVTAARQTIEGFRSRFEEAMDDDFNTAQALGHLHDLLRQVNTLLGLSKGRPTEEIAGLMKTGADLVSWAGVLFGLFRDDPECYLEGRKREGIAKLGIAEEEILRAIGERAEARKQKDWKRADDIRNGLLGRGVVLEDSASGTKWKLKD
jgi:cysteinyl-tRNA synthetase